MDIGRVSTTIIQSMFSGAVGATASGGNWTRGMLMAGAYGIVLGGGKMLASHLNLSPELAFTIGMVAAPIAIKLAYRSLDEKLEVIKKEGKEYYPRSSVENVTKFVNAMWPTAIAYLLSEVALWKFNAILVR
jgi:hypothetical protein